jgi:hypothetical protein
MLALEAGMGLRLFGRPKLSTMLITFDRDDRSPYQGRIAPFGSSPRRDHGTRKNVRRTSPKLSASGHQGPH